jgi:hypothetical protein
MNVSESSLPYHDLAAITDYLLDECGEDVSLLIKKFDNLTPVVRDDLLVSDLLNAFQVFSYFFREVPGDLQMERLILSPASDLAFGVLIDEIDLCKLIFIIVRNEPVMVVSDGEQVLAIFNGSFSYHDALSYIQSIL